MDTAARLFHVSFREEIGVPAWHASVETWDVLEKGAVIGRFYLDMHPRPGKYSHGAMFQVLDGVRGKQMAEAALVCNFPEPTEKDPGLMDYTEVITFFHEFGHLMHHILGGQQQWAGISGITTEGDFSEAPSLMLEEFMRSPQVLRSVAHHFKSGEAIPEDLVTRMNRVAAFGRANSQALQVAFSAVSHDLYKANPEQLVLDRVTLEDFRHYTGVSAPDFVAHFYASFSQLAGYSSMYYTYVWDRVIAEDFFLQFDRKNSFGGPTPMRYRRLVLEPGGSKSANDIVRSFLGRKPNMDAYQRWLTEEFIGPSHDQQSKLTQ